MIQKLSVFCLFVLVAMGFAVAKEPVCKRLDPVKAEFQNICPDCTITVLEGCKLGISIPPVHYDQLALTVDQRMMVSQYLENLNALSKRLEELTGKLNSRLRPADLEHQLEDIRADLKRTEDKDIFNLYKATDGKTSGSSVIDHFQPVEKVHFQIIKIRLSLVHADDGYPEFRSDVKKLKGYTEQAIKSLHNNYEAEQILYKEGTSVTPTGSNNPVAPGTLH